VVNWSQKYSQWSTLLCEFKSSLRGEISPQLEICLVCNLHWLLELSKRNDGTILSLSTNGFASIYSMYWYKSMWRCEDCAGWKKTIWSWGIQETINMK
jgi:hypothetical protein